MLFVPIHNSLKTKMKRKVGGEKREFVEKFFARIFPFFFEQVFHFNRANKETIFLQYISICNFSFLFPQIHKKTNYAFIEISSA